MKFHDYHLESYKVSERGEKIEFNLVYEYPGKETDDSQINFTKVQINENKKFIFTIIK